MAQRVYHRPPRWVNNKSNRLNSKGLSACGVWPDPGTGALVNTQAPAPRTNTRAPIPRTCPPYATKNVSEPKLAPPRGDRKHAVLFAEIASGGRDNGPLGNDQHPPRLNCHPDVVFTDEFERHLVWSPHR